MSRLALLTTAGLLLGQHFRNPDVPVRKDRGATTVWSKSVTSIGVGVLESVAVSGGLVTMVLPAGAPGASKTIVQRPIYLPDRERGEPSTTYTQASHMTGVPPGVYVTEQGWAELRRVWAEREKELDALKARCK